MKNIPALFFLCYFTSVIASTAQAQSGTAAEDPSNQPLADLPRYMGVVEFGYLYGKIENPFNFSPSYIASPSVLFFNGYRAHRLIAIGATIGFDFYENILITPIALGIRGEFFSTRVSPFYSLDAGYGTSFLSGKGSGERPEGGWLINPVLGLRVKTGNKAAFLVGMGYKRQRVDTEMSGWGFTTNQRITYNRLSLRMGFMF
jgi:hypothetical protein